MAQEPVANQEFRIDSDAGWQRVLAYPDRPLRRFGYHHVISHHGISGSVAVAPNPLESTIMLGEKPLQAEQFPTIRIQSGARVTEIGQ